ncbi:MAG: hypothetical protein H6721_31150 [Sandaracinus sp.]|nr:hypothetical protein [Sandaracinus sp.]
MGRLIGWVCMVGLASVAHAQTAPFDARVEFEAGVAQGTRGKWESAVESFERSLALTPRAATAFNLAVALHHVGRPARLLEVAAVFDALATAPRYEAQRVRVEELRRWAREALDQATVAEQTSLANGDPTGASDSMREPTAGGMDTPTHHSTPGPSAATDPTANPLPTTAIGSDAPQRETTPSGEIEASPETSGSTPSARDDASPIEAMPAERAPHDDEHAWSKRLRITTASLGASALAISLVATSLAVVAARDLDGADPQATGFLSDALRYRRLRAASVHAAWAGGVALAASLVVQRVRSRTARWTLRAMGLVLGLAGAALAISPPRRLGDTTLTGARRTVGLVMVSLGTPLVSLAWGAR